MNWGIAGYGRIARKFKANLEFADDEKLVAIASRSAAQQIPFEYRAYTNYKDLFADDEIDIIYISTTHNTHKEIAICALNAGKNVLCEKPMGTSVREVKEMILAAKSNNRFLMEAIWSRYLPSYRKVMELIHHDEIGKVELVQANFGFLMNPDDPKTRLMDKQLAGGAIWDVGIYPIMLAIDIFNETPHKIQSLGKLGNTGVEHRALINMEFSGGRMAQVSCGFDWATKNLAVIHGSSGQIVMNDFWKCENFTVHNSVGQAEYHIPMTSTGFYHEIVACSKLIKDGKLESPIIPWGHSLMIAKCMDSAVQEIRS